MADTLREMLTEYDNKKYATDTGSAMHQKMRFVNRLDDADDIIKQIKSRPELAIFFTENAQTEVPVAAIINGKFVSRRIDRMIVDDENKIVHMTKILFMISMWLRFMNICRLLARYIQNTGFMDIYCGCTIGRWKNCKIS